MKTLLVSVLLLCSACGPAFVAGDAPDESLAGQAGFAVAGSAGAPSAPSATAGAENGGDVSQAGQPSASGAPAGGFAGGADPAGTAGSGGSAELAALPCEGAVEAHSGYVAAGSDRCLRTTERFDTITCANWMTTIIKINGQQATCNKQAAFPPMVDGYNYIEFVGRLPPSGQLRWFMLTPVMPCAHPVTLTGDVKSLMVGMPAICIRTPAEFNAINGLNMDDRKITINGVPVADHEQVGFPPSTDGYNYITVSAGSDQSAMLSWSLMRIAQG